MRLTAMKVPICYLHQGELLRQPGEWGSSYILTDLGLAVGRASVVARVLKKFDGENNGAIVLDDTSQTIRARFFQDALPLMEKVEVGDLVEIVGKIREYQGERHIVAETLHVLEDENWWLLRKAEIVKQHGELKKYHAVYEEKKLESEGEALRKALTEADLPVWYVDGLFAGGLPLGEAIEETAEMASPKSVDSSAKETVLKVISENEMITYTDIITKSELESDVVDDAIETLIDEGEIFEPRSGKFKRL